MKHYALHLVCTFSLAAFVCAQDSSTGAMRGSVSDSTGAAIPGASVALKAVANGLERNAKSDSEGRFSFDLLPPGDYELRISAAKMATQVRKNVKVDIGGDANVDATLKIAATEESVSVEGSSAVETMPSAVSDVIDQRAINDFPLNGRRFTDLALLTPGVTQDPRGLTSSSSGDLAFGGVRGYQSSFLVDGITVESFNVLNRDNKRVDITDDGFSTSAGGFVQISKKVGSKIFPAYFQTNSSFLTPTNAYALRQIQMALRLKF